ncbi:hypothetical protein GCM10009756_20650 [Pseudokineococcus marinus]
MPRPSHVATRVQHGLLSVLATGRRAERPAPVTTRSSKDEELRMAVQAQQTWRDPRPLTGTVGVPGGAGRRPWSAAADGAGVRVVAGSVQV